MRCRFAFLAVALSCALATLATAREALPAPNAGAFSGLHWRCIGPFRGGRSVAVTGVPGFPERFYFGAVGGGVWRSDNAGRTWRPIFDGEPVASIGAIAVAPSDPNVIYVGSGEADFRSDLQQGNGMYKSTDAGATWQRIGLADTRAIGRISVDPHDPGDVVVAALGHPYGPNPERGIFRSTDGGATWRKALFVNEDTGAITVTRDPQHPSILYAALLQTRRPPWNVYPPSKGPGSGLYKSIDGGTTWKALRGNGFPADNLGRIGVAVAPTNANRVYAIVDAKDGGLYRSDDAGATWKHVDAERRIWTRGWYFEEVSVDPHDPDTVFVSNTSLYRSSDGGTTFTAIKGAPGGDDYHMLWLDPHDANRMILASDQGVVVSVDGAKSWSSWYNQPTAQLYHIAADAQFPFWVYGAQQDSGAIAVASRSLRRGIMQSDTMPLDVGGESDTIAPDPLHAGVVFGGRVDREDLTTHALRNLSPTLAHPGDWRETWTLPLAFSPVDPHVLYFSRQVLFKTADGGGTWQPISPDLTRDNPGIPPNLDAPAANDRDDPSGPPRGVIYAIAPSPLRAGMVWAGTDDGNLQLTRDNGATWTNVTPVGLSAWSKIGIIEASHFAPDTAYAAVDRHRLDDVHPYIYRTHDGGRTWSNVARGIPDGSFVNAVREDPVRRGLLYAGTETGVFVSFDDGDAWQPLQMNLPAASVRDLVVRDDALAVATHGRSFWILDDVTPLRQWTSAVARSRSWLFEPQTAYRVRNGSDEGTPFPPETPAGENPPDGAIVDYALGPRGATTVALEIRDAAGTLLRHWASTDPAPVVDASKLDIPVFWVQPPPVLGTAAGVHRFVWDLRYAPTVPASPDEEGDPFFVRGIWAVPGTYIVRLTVDGETVERRLTVRLDPRETATPADLAAQFTFSRTVEALRVEVLHAARRHPQNQRFAEIEAALGSIESAAQSAPAAPTPDERTAFDDARSAFAAASGSVPAAQQ
jgi:photosystem II stability/assembly factor-like uncharacterized protein